MKTTAVDEYDAQMREKAAAAGQPIMRMATPTIATEERPHLLVWQEEGGLRSSVLMVDGTLSQPKALTVNDLVDEAGDIIADADDTAAKLIAFTGIAARNSLDGDWVAANVHGRLMFSHTLRFPLRFVALTDALTRKFYVAPEFNLARLGDWCKALGVSTSGNVALRMQRLIRECQSSIEGFVNPYLSKVDQGEKWGASSAAYGSLSSQTSAFRSAEGAAAATEAMLAIDPLLTGRNVAERRLAVVKVTLQTANTVGVTLPETFSIRAGREVFILDPSTGRHAPATLTSIKLVERGGVRIMEGTIESSKSRPSDAAIRTLLGSAVLSELLVAEAPFLAFKGGRAKRWTITAQQRLTSTAMSKPDTQRQVPLEIVLAGAPVID